MKYIFILIYTVATVFIIYFFQSIEQWLIESNFSWTSAKIAPYFLLLILGLLIGRWMNQFLLFKLISNKIKLLKRIVFLVITFIPFGIGFALNPIYEGDFSKQGKEIQKDTKKDFKNADLAVITIPGCPFCYHSISKLKQLKRRNPSMRIKFIVCTDNDADLIDYRAEGGNEIVVVKTKNGESLGKLAEGKFPTFVMVQNNQAIYSWSNDQFGCRALDQLENQLVN